MKMSHLKTLASFTSTDPHRPQIGGVNIETHNGRIVGVATDGHRLLALELGESETPVNMFIPSDVLAKFKVGARTNDETTLVSEGETVTVSCAGINITFEKSERIYPDWKRIIPREFNGEVGQFNADYLASFRKASKAISGNEFFRLIHNGEQAARVLLPIEQTHVAVIMPVRANNTPINDDMPEWMVA